MCFSLSLRQYPQDTVEPPGLPPLKSLSCMRLQAKCQAQFAGRESLELCLRNYHTLKMDCLLMSVGSFCLERKAEGFS